jgi:hypothetical protein
MVDGICLKIYGKLNNVLLFAVDWDYDDIGEFVQNEVTRRGALYPHCIWYSVQEEAQVRMTCEASEHREF